MIDFGQPDLLIAFPLMGSIGTKRCIESAAKRGISTIIIRPESTKEEIEDAIRQA